ncbi:hypothetical protein [Mycolicibacterium canariasense]|uniref:hypothetical protein n=1 Tax=Mycolicibacterium canariasense TaxID=228230 RepID=UPI001F2DF9D8|nr:hypothetical protein [Mycolicibacterium canariasense]
MSINRPTTGWPTAVARYSPEISHAVADGGSPKATPIGTNATATTLELTGFNAAPETRGAISLGLNPPSRRRRCRTHPDADHRHRVACAVDSFIAISDLCHRFPRQNPAPQALPETLNVVAPTSGICIQTYEMTAESGLPQGRTTMTGTLRGLHN